jgi:hypothetical protein
MIGAAVRDPKRHRMPMARSSRALLRTVLETGQQFPDWRSTSDNSVYQLAPFCAQSEVGCYAGDERSPSRDSFEYRDRSMAAQSRRCVADRVPSSAPFACERLVSYGVCDLWASSQCWRGGSTAGLFHQRAGKHRQPFKKVRCSSVPYGCRTGPICGTRTGLAMP